MSRVKEILTKFKSVEERFMFNFESPKDKEKAFKLAMSLNIPIFIIGDSATIGIDKKSKEATNFLSKLKQKNILITEKENDNE